MKNVFLVFIVLLSFTVVGCATHTGVIPMGKDTFMATKQQGSYLLGLGTMKAELIAEGARHCSAQGKEFNLVSAQETQPPYIFGNYPRSEIQFTCLLK